MRHRWLVALAMALAGVAQASAQGWPSKPVRIIVPVTAGSATDVTARVVADHLAQQFGQPFVVENRTGAGGTTGMGYVAKSVEPDGYTILVHSAAFVIQPEIVDRKNPRMLELARDLRFADKSNHLLRLGLAFRKQHLHGHIPAQPGIVRREDRARAPLHRDIPHAVARETQAGRLEILEDGSRNPTALKRERHPAERHLAIEAHVLALLRGVAIDKSAIRAAEIFHYKLRVADDSEARVPAGNGLRFDDDLIFAILPDHVAAPPNQAPAHDSSFFGANNDFQGEARRMRHGWEREGTVTILRG